MSRKESVGDRILKLRKALGYERNAREMAERLQQVVGSGTVENRLYEWEAGKPFRPETLAAIAMLHPDPAACLEWLRLGGRMPPTRSDEPALERIASDARYFRELAERFSRAADALTSDQIESRPLPGSGDPGEGGRADGTG